LPKQGGKIPFRGVHDIYLILFTLTPVQCQRIIEGWDVRRSQARKVFREGLHLQRTVRCPMANRTLRN